VGRGHDNVAMAAGVARWLGGWGGQGRSPREGSGHEDVTVGTRRWGCRVGDYGGDVRSGACMGRGGGVLGAGKEFADEQGLGE